MKKMISIVAVLSLSACMGGGSDDVSIANQMGDLTPSSPDLSLNNDFGTIMNNARTASGDIAFDNRLASAAQKHANDMFTRNFDTVTVKDEMIADSNEPSGFRLKDLGDLANSEGYDWVDLGQLIARGEATPAEAEARWSNETCLDAVRTCFNDPFENFGLGKAGSGGDQRWVMILANPKP